MSDDTTTGLEAEESYRIGADDETSRREFERLRALARWRDPFTIDALRATGVGEGWRCLEVGAGAGSISEWMADAVGSSGSVLSTDVDLRFHGEPRANVEVRKHDITSDALPDDEFDLVHVRAVLQHIAEREGVLDRLVATLKPGGWLVAEEGDFRAFEAQPLPEPLGALHRMVCQASAQQAYRETNFGTRLLHLLQERGLCELTAEGHADTMRAGEDSAEWWFLAVEHVRDAIVDAGAFDGADFDRALAQARTPGFVMLGPLSIQVRGRKP
jgi:ubiquinone/menaquinone biosynthesis C-methylase UbiE